MAACREPESSLESGELFTSSVCMITMRKREGDVEQVQMGCKDRAACLVQKVFFSVLWLTHFNNFRKTTLSMVRDIVKTSASPQLQKECQSADNVARMIALWMLIQISLIGNLISLPKNTIFCKNLQKFTF